MYYVCVEEGRVTSVMPYEPAVPETVTVFEISDEEYTGITQNKTHFFNLETNSVEEFPQEHLDSEEIKKQQKISNAEKREFLNSTDWQVFRHLRQKALGQDTTLTEEEYLALEQSRADAAAAIVQIQ